MSLSFYEVSVGQYLQMLGATTYPEYGRGQCRSRGTDLGVMVNFRLQDNVHPFSFQAVSIWRQSLGVLRAMRDGLFEPPIKVDDTSSQDLCGLVDQAVEGLSQETEESTAALSDKTMVFRGGEWRLPLPTSNPNFLLSFSLSNFYFHVTTVYDMLPLHGVPLERLNFKGQMKTGIE